MKRVHRQSGTLLNSCPYYNMTTLEQRGSWKGGDVQRGVLIVILRCNFINRRVLKWFAIYKCMTLCWVRINVLFNKIWLEGMCTIVLLNKQVRPFSSRTKKGIFVFLFIFSCFKTFFLETSSRIWRFTRWVLFNGLYVWVELYRIDNFKKFVIFWTSVFSDGDGRENFTKQKL